MTETPNPPRGLSLYERFMRARRWFWASWTDEAVMIYRRSAHGKDRARVLWVEFLLFIREIIREFYRVEGTARAASLAYTTLLSMIPLLVAFAQRAEMRAQLMELLDIIIPYKSPQIIEHLNRFAENAAAASTFGVIVFLLISFRLFMAVEATINQIWRVQTWRGYPQKIRAFTMLLFWGPVLIGVSFTTTASLERNTLLQAAMQHRFLGDLIATMVPLLVLFVAFTMLFWLVPSTRVNIRSALIGAAITAVLFELVRFGFGVYAEHLFKGNLNVVYGTLGLAILFLVALDLMWVVILVGVEISYVHQNLHGILRAAEKQIEENPAYDLYFAFRALIEISRRFERREDAPSSYRLAEEFGATDQQMLRILRRLEDAQLVKEIGGDWTGFAPGCDPDRITVEEVVRHMEGGGREIPAAGSADQVKELLGGLYTTLRECTTSVLEHQTIGRLVREVYGPRKGMRETEQVEV